MAHRGDALRQTRIVQKVENGLNGLGVGGVRNRPNRAGRKVLETDHGQRGGQFLGKTGTEQLLCTRFYARKLNRRTAAIDDKNSRHKWMIVRASYCMPGGIRLGIR